MLRGAEADFRRSYARVLDAVAELEEEKAGAIASFGAIARSPVGVLNLSKAEAKAQAEQAQLLAPRRSLTGEMLPRCCRPRGGPGRRCDRRHPLRVIIAVKRRSYTTM